MAGQEASGKEAHPRQILANKVTADSTLSSKPAHHIRAGPDGAAYAKAVNPNGQPAAYGPIC